MKKRIIYNSILWISLCLLAFGATMLGAIHEKDSCQYIDNEEGSVLFHENYNDTSLADIYTPEEAIRKLKQLQKDISEINPFVYFSEIAFPGIEDVKVIGEDLRKELKGKVKEGTMIDPEIHITNMKKIVIPAMVSEELEDQYAIGDIVKGNYQDIPVYLKIEGILEADSYVESVDTYFSTFTIPKLCFDGKAVSEKEKIFQEWFLSATIGGMVCYRSSDEYRKVADQLEEITDSVGLEWKLEDQSVNRYAETKIPVSEKTAYLCIVMGIVTLFCQGLVYCLDRRKKQETDNSNIVIQTKITLKESIHAIGCYVILVVGVRIFLKNSTYLQNFLEEKGCVLFFLIFYIVMVSAILCRQTAKMEVEHECN